MSVIRSLSVGFLLLLPVSMQAIAYQYVRYAPSTNVAAQNAYNQPARAPYPYYPAYRYPVQPAPSPGYIQQWHRQARHPAGGPVVSNNTRAAAAKNATVSYQNRTPDPVNSAIDSKAVLSEKKQDFIEILLPHIEKENQRLSKLRKNVLQLFSRINGNVLSRSEKRQLQTLAKTYRVEGDPLTNESARDNLLRKIDIIPSSLALAQAANESAWGKSRFAQEANNVFGIWTYDESIGLKPKNRAQGKTHLVRIFDDLGDSVRYYMHTLNSNPAYQGLRDIRHQLRNSRQVIDGHELANGLEKYSAKGRDYITLIQRLIRQNEWARLDTDNQRA